MMGAVAPLVPGIAITNAIRDMMARHYISGMIVAIEALFTANALGAGIASASYLFLR
ncbi:threonine/serine exporter family protein [Paenibacillus sp. E194]|uniref:threonine/serine exporter family protein n=1 Tax=Paenibacillus sp. E194 TaxID=1458845 RepID=UPI0009E55A8E|nr:threonine/serine exporter family protein [Paenibacillus sp. E194]